VTTAEHVARAVLEGEHDEICYAPPRLRPDLYARIVRVALATHDTPADADPEHLVRAEGLRVSWQRTPGRCGGHVGELVLLAWRQDPLERGLLITHERAHAWLRRCHWHDATEADAWLLTAAFVAAGAERTPAYPWAPPWFVAMAIRNSAAISRP
jgi:hypothetical protein